MAVMLGHAASDRGHPGNGDHGTSSDGRTEVLIQPYFTQSWGYVLRHPDESVARRAAQECQKGCNNNHIGYSQSNRLSASREAESNGWALSNITQDCATDCSAFMTLCYACAGVSQFREMISKNQSPSTQNMLTYFTNAGFSALDNSSGKNYLSSSDNLKVGDVLLSVSQHHTAMVLEDGAMASDETPVGTSNASAIATSNYYSVSTTAYFSEDWNFNSDGGDFVAFKNPNQSYKQFMREYRLRFGTAGGTGYEIGERTEACPQPPHITFTVNKTATNVLGNAKINIYNLNDEHISVLENVGDITVQLSVGYGDRLFNIFTGTVMFCTSTKQGADWCTTLDVICNQTEIVGTYVECSFDKNTPWETIFKDVCRQIGILYVTTETVKFKTCTDGFSFIGSAKEAFNKICESNAVVWSVQNGVVQVKHKGEVMNQNICYLISSETGMIGSPQQIRNADLDWTVTSFLDYGLGFDVSFLLNGAIGVSDFVEIRSERYSGFFSVASVNINGDNEGGGWQCKARVTPLLEGGANTEKLYDYMTKGYYVTQSGLTTQLPTSTPTSWSSSNLGAGSANNFKEYVCRGQKHYTEEDVIVLAKTMYGEWGAGRSYYADSAGYASTVQKGNFQKYISAELIWACGIWTILNGIDNRVMGGNANASYYQSPAAFCKYRPMSWVAYSPNYPTKSVHGYDLCKIARDVLERWSGEKNGETNVGRCLPKEYTSYYGDVADPNMALNSTLGRKARGADLLTSHFFKTSEYQTKNPDFCKTLKYIDDCYDYYLGDPYA